MSKLTRAHDKWFKELQLEYGFHNQPHNCYYLTGPDAGVSTCPAEYPNFQEFTDSRGFPSFYFDFLGLDENGRISGQENDSLNSRSDDTTDESAESVQDMANKVSDLTFVIEKLATTVEVLARSVARMNTEIKELRKQAPVDKLEIAKPAYKEHIKVVVTNEANDYYSSLQNYDRLENGISAGSKPETNITYDSKYSTIQSQKIKDIVEEELKKESYFRRGHGFAGT